MYFLFIQNRMAREVQHNSQLGHPKEIWLAEGWEVPVLAESVCAALTPPQLEL